MNNTLNTQPTPFKSNQNNGYNEDGTLGGEFLGNVKKFKGSYDKFMVLLNDSYLINLYRWKWDRYN